MSLTARLSFATVYLLGAMSSGPSFVMVIRNTLIGARFHGIGTYALFSITGLVILIQDVPPRLSMTFLGRNRLPNLAGLGGNHFQGGFCG